ncbi:MAG: spiro-SPASM protein [Leptospiraceae bacterium]|nr:spiro-SPASM protein [Leptospiraceae bacterium]
MKLRLSGIYIHLPDSGSLEPDSLNYCIQAFGRQLIAYSRALDELSSRDLISRGPRAITNSPLLAEILDGAADGGPALEYRSLPDHPYDALSQLMARPGLPVEDLEARMETWAFFHGIAPLMDLSRSLDLLGRHVRFLSSYTYAENLPPGLSPDYVGVEFFELQKRPESDLHSFVFKNFHELDAEVAFYLPDLRIHRLDFSGQSNRSLRLCKAILESGSSARFQDEQEVRADFGEEQGAIESFAAEGGFPSSLSAISSLLEQSPEIFRIAPSYLEIELNTASPVQDRLLLAPSETLALSADQRKEILNQLSDFLTGDVTVCLGGRGDSGADESAPEFALELLAQPSVQSVYVETYGYDMSRWLDFLLRNAERAEELATSGRLVFIVRLCSLRQDRYQHFYSGGDVSRIMAELEACQKALEKQEGPGFSVYVEMQKIKEVEDEIHGFFQKYDPTPLTPILRKQNTYGGLLEDRKISDLSPPIRGFCWHLSRDLYINASGRIPICRQVPDGPGPVLADGLLQAFSRMQKDYVHSMKGEHDSISAPCLDCDEWYLFQA